MVTKNKSQSSARTRRKVLEHIKLQGPSSADSLGDALGVTAMAVRQHLYGLTDEGLVEWREQPNPRGRPSKLWRLTASGNEVFPNAHADLTVEIITAMRAALDEPSFEQVLEFRRQAQLAGYKEELETHASLKDRLHALAVIRTREGYMCEVDRGSESDWLLIEKHCPICTAASACQGLCASELRLFRDLLGDNVSVERTDHMVQGATRCVYTVKAA